VLQKPLKYSLLLSAVVLFVGFVCQARVQADDPRAARGAIIEICPHCQRPLSNAVYYSDFYGYYRTCWRRWPNTQPPCPPSTPPAEIMTEVPTQGAEKPAGAPASQNAPEILPTPKPDIEKK